MTTGRQPQFARAQKEDDGTDGVVEIRQCDFNVDKGDAAVFVGLRSPAGDLPISFSSSAACNESSVPAATVDRRIRFQVLQSRLQPWQLADCLIRRRPVPGPDLEGMRLERPVNEEPVNLPSPTSPPRRFASLPAHV